MTLITVADAKMQLNKLSSVDDTELRLYVDAASAVVQRHTGVDYSEVTVPPANVKLAALIIVQHLWETQRGSMPGSFPTLDDSLGIDARGGSTYLSGYALPNQALELLGGPDPLGFA